MERPTQAIILAAGRGTRLGSLAADRPKALVKVADRSLIDHVRHGLARAGVRRAIIVVGHLAEQIESHLAANPVAGQTSIPVWQPVPQGTGQAVKIAIPALDAGPTWITYADILVDLVEYVRMADFFTTELCDMALAVNAVDDPCRGAAVYFDESRRISRIVEKPAPGTSATRWNSAGIYIAQPALFPYLNALLPSSRGEYELPDAIVGLINSGGDVRAHEITTWWSDVGRPEDVERMEGFLRASREAERKA